jgi:hypothetical protein
MQTLIDLSLCIQGPCLVHLKLGEIGNIVLNLGLGRQCYVQLDRGARFTKVLFKFCNSILGNVDLNHNYNRALTVHTQDITN